MLISEPGDREKLERQTEAIIEQDTVEFCFVANAFEVCTRDWNFLIGRVLPFTWPRRPPNRR